MCADSAPWRRQPGQVSSVDTLNSDAAQPSSNISSLSTGNNTSVSCVPVPPPPPPPGPGTLPSLRITTEIADTKGINRGTQEPPAAIQNAMMTKDKKPFTYTPGGLDLSEIRSPRMQKRISRNAHAEGVTGEQTQGVSQQQAAPLPPSALAAMQPQVAIPVFPHERSSKKGPLQAPTAPPSAVVPSLPESPLSQSSLQKPVLPAVPNSHPKTPISSVPKGPVGWTTPTPIPTSSPLAQAQESNFIFPATPSACAYKSAQNEPGSIYVPPVTATSRAQMGSLYVPPVTAATQIQQQPPQQNQPQSPGSPLPQLQKAPTPWMSQKPQTQAPPPWVQRQESEQKKLNQDSTTRIIPIQIEGRDSPRNAPVPTQASNIRIIPIQIEKEMDSTCATPKAQNQQQQHNLGKQGPSYAPNKFTPASPNHVESIDGRPVQLQHQISSSGAPIQSRSFRVLQKITDTDGAEANESVQLSGANQQLRKLELSDDDRALMNKFKAQVDEESFLHNEPDPRYRGAAIPSRAFRMLQTMTDTVGDTGEQPYVPRDPGSVRGPQNCGSFVQPANDESPSRQYIHPSEQLVQEPRKYTGGAIPSRSFRMLQAMTAGTENHVSDCEDSPVPNSQSGYDQPGVESWGNVFCPSPYPQYWNYPDSWWGYYSDTDNIPQYWNPYSAMYAYMAKMNPYGYSSMPYPPPIYPHNFAPPTGKFYHGQRNSDSDELSGYSSTDEMAYYGANFSRKSAFPENVKNNSEHHMHVPSEEELQETKCLSQPESKHEIYVETSGSDTEVEDDDDDDDEHITRSVKAIQSVSDISIYKSESEIISSSSELNKGGTEHEDETEDEDEEEEDYDDDYEHIQIKEESNRVQDIIPHQLSIIFEESEQSDIGTHHDEDESTATVEESDVDLDSVDPPSSTVTVCLPLKLKFSRSENDEEVTTVIVGDSHVKRAHVLEKEQYGMQTTKIHGNTDISVTLSFPSGNKFDEGEQLVSENDLTEEAYSLSRQMSTSDVEYYETAESDSDVSVCLSLPLKQKQKKISRSSNMDPLCHTVEEEGEEEENKIKNEENDFCFVHCEDDTSSSISIQNMKLEDSRGRSSSSEAETVISAGKTSTSLIKTITETESFDDNSNISENEDQKEDESDDESSTSSSRASSASGIETSNCKKDITECIVNKIFDLCTTDENQEKSNFEESEEDDSGVTSDISRHISDADTESDELIRCQRASTHSRLFKLLQDECAAEDEEESIHKPRRDNLTLPLHTGSDPDSLSSSSGIASPSSPTITDRLVKELIHTLLQRKKGKRLKKLPLAKLHAAALRILQEDMDPYDTGSSITSEESSPIRQPIHTTLVQQPHRMTSQSNHNMASISYEGANYYYDYCNYYNSWANAAAYYSGNPTFDYIPSQTFEHFREHAQPDSFSSGVIDGHWAECPRYQSSKNTHKENETDSNSSETRPQSSRCST